MLQTEAAHDSSKQLLLVDIILLVVEGAVLIPMAFLYMYWVICTITIDRVSLYSIFLRVPRPTVVAISKAEVRLVGEEGFDDDDDPVVRVVASSASAVQSTYCHAYIAPFQHSVLKLLHDMHTSGARAACNADEC